MKAAKLRDQTIEELQQLLGDTRKELVELKVKRGLQDASQSPMRVRTLRRDVARIRTIMREREAKAHG